MRREAGVTLIEVLIAVTLLSLLSAGMMVAMRVGLNAFSKTDSRLMSSRRVAGAQRILHEQLEGLMPVVTLCGGVPDGPKTVFFEGGPQSMRFVSTFSLQQAWRGRPQILEYLVIPGEEGRGVRLVVNEAPYTGPLTAGRQCLSVSTEPVSGASLPHFTPALPGPDSFVLADKLAYCRFSYYVPSSDPNRLARWNPIWALAGWPTGIRVEMAPLDPDPAGVQPITVTAALHLWRSPEIHYEDR